MLKGFLAAERTLDLMKAIGAFIKSHPLLSYFALAFAVSWGVVLIVIVVGHGSILATKEQFETLIPFVGPAMLLGPSVAGILLTGILYGKAGFRDLLARMTKWRVGARWYAVALLTAPLVFTAILLTLSLRSREFLPLIFTSDEKAALLLMGIVGGLVVGFFEELGWTGFAIPTLMRLRYGVLGTGLIVGVLWGAWHLLVAFWSSSSASGEPALVSFLLDAFLFLVAFRVLMVWVYERTGGSLLVAILMHMSLVATVQIINPFGPLKMAGVPLLTFDLIWAVVLCIILAAVAVAQGGHLTRQPPLRRRVT
jgi:membrane protease YdiL (CAAX protease family)